ncbi:MAG: hypothetical protein HPY50_10570 [Firmicutes bacterium]|nr:hypothetical protein [Bacillota bacterium]
MTSEFIAGNPDHLRLIEEIDSRQVALVINPNKAMNWLMGDPSPGRLPFEKGMAFNYIQWLILLPGVVALFLIPLAPALILLVGCAVLSWLVSRIKSKVLQSGVTEFIRQDLDSLNELYEKGAISFRRVRPKNQPLIKHPTPWTDVLPDDQSPGDGGGDLVADGEYGE